jgi:hypothetical protein
MSITAVSAARRREMLDEQSTPCPMSRPIDHHPTLNGSQPVSLR